jgi:hypothetical protein
VLLPVVMLARRADVVTVIGAAISAAAAGDSRRRIAAIVDRPLGTVRSWLRRFDDRCEQVRAFFTGLLRDVAPDPVVPEPAGSVGADAVAAIGLAAQAIADRFSVSTLTPWRVAAAASHGQLLAPGWQPESINTSSLWAMLF